MQCISGRRWVLLPVDIKLVYEATSKKKTNSTMIQYFVWFSLFTCSLCRLTEFYRWKQIEYQHLSKSDREL